MNINSLDAAELSQLVTRGVVGNTGGDGTTRTGLTHNFSTGRGKDKTLTLPEVRAAPVISLAIAITFDDLTGCEGRCLFDMPLDLRLSVPYHKRSGFGKMGIAYRKSSCECIIALSASGGRVLPSIQGEILSSSALEVHDPLPSSPICPRATWGSPDSASYDCFDFEASILGKPVILG
jgi:hypothetical protein